ncbi:MAG: serine protease [Gemmataceae bacterium]|nr:serine protease [Gemmataceae bacterium]MDW8264867.1 serine protease [Gemmataceae bacterium]
MDGRQQIVQRTRELLGDRLEDVLHMVRQDRHGLRGWEEPAHLRSVVRRTVAQEVGGGEREEGDLAVAVADVGRCTGEADPGQQREALGELLEMGASALEKVLRQQVNELTPAELIALECVVLFYGRPAILVRNGRLGAVPATWTVLEDQREDIEMCQRGVGRIELLDHPDYDWAGTAFLVNETTLLTTRRCVELFAEPRDGRWQFRPGISAWMNYRSGDQRVASAGYRIRAVLGVHEQYDLALLDVEPPQVSRQAPTPLALMAQCPPRLEGRPVYLISYPIRDARRSEPEVIARICRDVYNVKRVQPGLIRRCFRFQNIELMQHDCAQLGQSSGGCLVDLETHQVVGLQLSSRYLETSTAIPLWVLRDDPLLKQAGVTFAEASQRDLEGLMNQLERLSRSRYWPEVRATIGNLYQRAFGTLPPGNY